MVPVEGSRQLHAAITGSTLIELPGQGHMDWFTDPSELAGLVQRFIQE
jgi:pimeloyl-ACP methyl ester carboxylesterase